MAPEHAATNFVSGKNSCAMHFLYMGRCVNETLCNETNTMHGKMVTRSARQRIQAKRKLTLIVACVYRQVFV